MPIRQWSSIVQPCSTARCPTVTQLPTAAGEPSMVWTIEPSWMFEFDPIRIGSMSPRRTDVNQMLEFSPISTSPIMSALSATKAEGAIRGTRPA